MGALGTTAPRHPLGAEGRGVIQFGLTKRTFSMIAASFVVATGLFWGRMLTSPPVAEAVPNVGITVAEIEAPKNLPSFDDNYQAYTGVLDTLRR